MKAQNNKRTINKKILSIVMVVAMLLMNVALVSPAFADDGSVAESGGLGVLDLGDTSGTDEGTSEPEAKKQIDTADKYEIVFRSAGGIFNNTDDNSKTKTVKIVNGKVNDWIYGVHALTAPEGRMFSHWEFFDNGTQASKENVATALLSDDDGKIDLKAVYVDLIQVTYVAGNAEGLFTAPVDSKDYEPGKTIKLQSATDDVIAIENVNGKLINYVFAGWKLTGGSVESGGVVYNYGEDKVFNENQQVTLLKDATFRAQWAKVYTITYLPGAEDVTGMPNTTVKYKEEGAEFKTADKPQREGYTFVAWEVTAGETVRDNGTDKNVGDTINQNKKIVAISDVTLTAVWEEKTDNNTGNEGDDNTGNEGDDNTGDEGDDNTNANTQVPPTNAVNDEEPEQLASYTVTVNYVDENGAEIRTAYTSTGVEDTDYDVSAQTAPSIDGYDFVSTTGAASGVLSGDVVITSTYAAEEIEAPVEVNYNLTVNYVSEAGISIIAPYTSTALEGTEYDLTANVGLFINGYTFLRSEGADISGTLSGDVVIECVYAVAVAPVAATGDETPVVGDDAPTTNIVDNQQPLAAQADTDNANTESATTEIAEEEAPLAAEPETTTSNSLFMLVIVAAGLLSTISLIVFFRKKREQQD